MANWTTRAAGLLLAGLLAGGFSACAKKTSRAGDAAALIGEGWTAYRLSEFPSAQLSCEAAMQPAARGSEEWAMATYGLATTWDLRRPGEDPKLVIQLYQEILAAAPDSPMIPWTELALARHMYILEVGLVGY